jgi:hypothetical protein
MDLSGKEFQEALAKNFVPALEEDTWPVCTGGYRVEGWGDGRYLVPAYDVDLKTKWRLIKPLEEDNLVPDFIKAHRQGTERGQHRPWEASDFERPIIHFVERYGIGLTGIRRWAGGKEETVRDYITVMQQLASLVRLFETLVSGKESDVRAALEACPGVWLCDITAGEIAVGTTNDGANYDMSVEEHALTGLGYFVGKHFHQLCHPFAIPEPQARRLDEVRTGWGFSNLTGAMFFHLYELLGAQDKIARCRYCGSLIRNAQKNTKFCRNNGACRNAYDHHSGRRAERARRKGSII